MAATNKVRRERGRLKTVMSRLKIGDVWTVTWSDSPKEKAMVTRIHHDDRYPWSSTITVVELYSRIEQTIGPDQLEKWHLNALDEVRDL